VLLGSKLDGLLLVIKAGATRAITRSG